MLLAAAGAAVAAALLVRVAGGQDPPPPIADRVGSVEVPGAEVVIGDEPAAYRIVYRLEQAGGGGDDDIGVLTDVVEVRRPFESRLRTREGAPPGGDVLSEQVGRLGHLESRGSNRATATFTAIPGVAPSDIRVAHIIDALVARGLAERREVREVIGRRCQVYRTAGPLSAKSLEPIGDDEHADNCIDEQGLVLEELYVVDGKPLSRRVATSLDVDPAFDDGTFRTEKVTIPVDKGGGSVREVEPDSIPDGEEGFWQLPSPPDGFEHVGRFSVVPPQPENFADPLRRKFILATVADVYVDGGAMIVVDQGATLEGGVAFEPAPPGTPTVEVGALGTAEVHLGADGAEVRVNIRQGEFVRVYGTVGVDRLVDVARSLERVRGTGLVYRD